MSGRFTPSFPKSLMLAKSSPAESHEEAGPSSGFYAGMLTGASVTVLTVLTCAYVVQRRKVDEERVGVNEPLL